MVPQSSCLAITHISFILCVAGVLVIAGNVDPALAGLALVYSLDLTRYLKHGTNMAAKAESDFNSVERILQYLAPEPEAAPETTEEVVKTMPQDWPNAGAITVQSLQMRYRPETPLVLKVCWGLWSGIKQAMKVSL